MVCITVELIRKRAEHHSASLFELEELSLAQQHVDKIDLLGRMCPNLKILTLQANSIVRLENLSRLKVTASQSAVRKASTVIKAYSQHHWHKLLVRVHIQELRYLNVAMNRISRCENLQGCELLQKLDLTLNSIGIAELPSFAALQANLQLRRIYLLGNPCTAWPEHRQYVVAILPQIVHMDGTDILRSERIESKRQLSKLTSHIHSHRDDTHVSAFLNKDDRGTDDLGMATNSPATNCHTQSQIPATLQETVSTQVHEDDNGRPRQKNQGKWAFELKENNGTFVLTLLVGKFMSMDNIDIDVQPSYVHVLLKGQTFCLHLPVEANTSTIQADHSTVTGVLTILMHTARGYLTHAHSKQSDTNGTRGPSRCSGDCAKNAVAGIEADVRLHEHVPDVIH